MAEVALLDTGPLVAFFNKRDNWHSWAVDTISTQSTPLITCDSVLSETLFLVKNNPAVTRALQDMIKTNVLACYPVLSVSDNDVLDRVLRYSDLPGSLADLSLIYLYEQVTSAKILTLDSDFYIYRDSKSKPIRMLSPF